MIDEKKIQNAFAKIKEDMLFFEQELVVLKQEIQEVKQILQILQSNTSSAELRHSAHIPTHNLRNYALKQSNLQVSIGNKGVPTNRQQTDNRHKNELKRTLDDLESFEDFSSLKDEAYKESEESEVSVSNLIDSMRKDLGEKFKKLTQKEFLVFSILYMLEEEMKNVTYNDLAQRAGLAESSVRDYVGRLIRKGIPIEKRKLNNKIVVLRIPRQLKDIATLDKLSRLKGFQ